MNINDVCYLLIDLYLCVIYSLIKFSSLVGKEQFLKLSQFLLQNLNCCVDHELLSFPPLLHGHS